MPRWCVSAAAIFFAVGCRAEMSSNLTARIRDRLLKPSAGYRDHAMYRESLNWLMIQDGVKLSAILPEAENLALEADACLASDKPEASSDIWRIMCARMLALLEESGDRRFLPTIERLALNAHDERNRLDAVRACIGICGFDSLPLVQKAVEAAPAHLTGAHLRFRLTQLLLQKMDNEAAPRERIVLLRTELDKRLTSVSMNRRKVGSDGRAAA